MPDCGGRYGVDATGCVWSRTTKRGVLAPSWRIAKLHPDKNGYLMVNLRRNGEHWSAKVHRLVVEAFIGPIPRDHEVNHRDALKTHNTADNLEIVTRAANMKHASALGLMRGRVSPTIKQERP